MPELRSRELCVSAGIRPLHELHCRQVHCQGGPDFLRDLLRGNVCTGRIALLHKLHCRQLRIRAGPGVLP